MVDGRARPCGRRAGGRHAGASVDDAADVRRRDGAGIVAGPPACVRGGPVLHRHARLSTLRPPCTALLHNSGLRPHVVHGGRPVAPRCQRSVDGQVPRGSCRCARRLVRLGDRMPRRPQAAAAHGPVARALPRRVACRRAHTVGQAPAPESGQCLVSPSQGCRPASVRRARARLRPLGATVDVRRARPRDRRSGPRACLHMNERDARSRPRAAAGFAGRPGRRARPPRATPRR